MKFQFDRTSAIHYRGRYGMVEVCGRDSIWISSRIFPSLPSLWDQWLDSHWRRLPPNTVRLYFNQPFSVPGFLVLAYAQAGPKTSPNTLQRGLRVLDQLAIERNLQAIVCHATHPKLSESVMKYFGYTRHAHHLRGLHFIRRIDSLR